MIDLHPLDMPQEFAEPYRPFPKYLYLRISNRRLDWNKYCFGRHKGKLATYNDSLSSNSSGYAFFQEIYPVQKITFTLVARAYERDVIYSIGRPDIVPVIFWFTQCHKVSTYSSITHARWNRCHLYWDQCFDGNYHLSPDGWVHCETVAQNAVTLSIYWCSCNS